MTFSIIIPTYKRNDLLTLCLQRLQPAAQSLEASLYEVIVTDDAADDATEQLLLTQFPWATYTAGPHRGPAANRNHGASLAIGQWLVFTDDDCLPDAQWLQAYADAIELHPDCKAFEGAILPDDWALLKKDMAECPVNTEGGCFWSANIMLAQSLFQELGGFDEQFTIAAQEDQDLHISISTISSITFVNDAIVVHPVRFFKLSDRIKNIRPQSFNWILFLNKHYKPKERIVLINKSLIIHAKCMVKMLLKGNIYKSIYHLSAFLFVLFNRNQLFKATEI